MGDTESLNVCTVTKPNKNGENMSCVTCHMSPVTNTNSHSHKTFPCKLPHYAQYYFLSYVSDSTLVQTCYSTLDRNVTAYRSYM